MANLISKSMPNASYHYYWWNATGDFFLLSWLYPNTRNSFNVLDRSYLIPLRIQCLPFIYMLVSLFCDFSFNFLKQWNSISLIDKSAEKSVQFQVGRWSKWNHQHAGWMSIQFTFFYPKFLIHARVFTRKKTCWVSS